MVDQTENPCTEDDTLRACVREVAYTARRCEMSRLRSVLGRSVREINLIVKKNDNFFRMGTEKEAYHCVKQSSKQDTINSCLLTAYGEENILKVTTLVREMFFWNGREKRTFSPLNPLLFLCRFV